MSLVKAVTHTCSPMVCLSALHRSTLPLFDRNQGIIAITLYWELNGKILPTCSTHDNDNTSPDINPSTNNNDNGEHKDVEIGQVVRSCPTEKERPSYHSANVMHRNWKSLIPLYTTLLHGEELTVPYSSLVACHNNIFDDMGYKTEFTTSRDNDEDSQRSATLNTLLEYSRFWKIRILECRRQKTRYVHVS